jgi:quinol monooxygenase YgiN
LVIHVDFRVKPVDHEAFECLVIENAAASLADEKGCRQFDVLVPEGAPAGQFVLYEIYDDAAAFDVHLKSEHYRRFDAATKPIVTGKTVTRLVFAEE